MKSQATNVQCRAIIFLTNIRSLTLSDDLLHSINNQLAVVMGNAELLGLKVENHKTQEACREIQAAASRINRLMYEYVNRNCANRNTSTRQFIKTAS
jgi:nitrogen-specific signal transduction histidine kinase